MEKITITGGTGFSGGHLVNYFREKQKIPVQRLGGRGHLADFSDPEHLILLSDIVVHTAYQSPDIAVTADDLANNISSTRNLIKAAKEAGTRYIIFFSSTSLYGTINGGVLHRDSPVINPNVYGMTKLISERLFQESGITTTSLRLPLIIGKGCKRNWIARMNEIAEAGKPVTLYNPMAKFNNAVHIDYVCEYVKELVDRFSSGYEVPNTCLLGSSDSVSIGAVARAVVNGRVPIIEQEMEDKSYTINIWGEAASVRTPWDIHWTLHRYTQDLFGE